MGRMTHMQSSHSVCSTSKLLSMLCPQPGHSAIGMPAAIVALILPDSVRTGEQGLTRFQALFFTSQVKSSQTKEIENGRSQYYV